jgi:hypothetical protein
MPKTFSSEFKDIHCGLLKKNFFKKAKGDQKQLEKN